MPNAPYDFAAIEKKWQKIWDEEKTFAASDDFSKPKYYTLIEFPYPSGAGTARRSSALDTRPWTLSAAKSACRAIMCCSPSAGTLSACPLRTSPLRTTFTRLLSLRETSIISVSSSRCWAFGFDWDREINTTDPSYYKWTQWIFLQLYKHGLAYKTEMPVNWCTVVQVSCLANEEVVNGVCERCGSEVVHKVKSQWMLQNHRLCREAARRSGRRGFHREGKDAAAQLDRPF